jgi:hypothetical protein
MTQQIVEIPLSPTPQTLTVLLGNIYYQLNVQYRDTLEGGWFLDISDSTGVPLVQGIPMITGANLLEQYAYLGIDADLRVQTDNDPDAVPTYTNLGLTSHLYSATIV